MNRLAVKIKESRIAAGLTEKELAKKCGLSINYIIQVESGKKIVNESVADKILKALGTKEEFVSEEPVKEQPKKTKENIFTGTIPVTPNETWADALAGVIKKYPIYDMLVNKIVAYKDLPIINKKIEGHHPDKLMFVKTYSDDMSSFRIHQGDILTILINKDIQNHKLYLIEMNGGKMVRQIIKESNKKFTLLKSKKDPNPQLVDMKKVKVLGKVIKNEFSL